MKYTLITAHYDVDTGRSSATISTPYGHFTGYVDMLPEEPYPSKYFGCRLAELKALKYAEKAALRQLRAELRALQNYFNLLMDTRSFDEDSFHVKKLIGVMDELKRRIDVSKYNVRKLAQSYHDEIVEHDKTLTKLHYKGE